MAETPIMSSSKVLDNVYVSPPKKPLTLDDKAEIAFKYLKELTQERYRFTNEQMDIAVRLPINLLPPNDQETLTDVARHNGVPYWQAVYAQFRRSNENGFSYALLLDPGWISEETVRLEERECPVCHTMFPPATFGQKFCGNICGAAKDKESYENNRPKEVLVPAAEPGIVPIGAENVFEKLNA